MTPPLCSAVNGKLKPEEVNLMAQTGKEYLSELVNAVICTPNAFRISIEGGKYLLSISTDDQKTSDWYAVSAIYDSICEVDKRIKYAFEQAILYNLPETLEGYKPFSKLTEEENIALYHVENIVFRVSILWDLLAQLCNILCHTGLSVEQVYYNRYFDKYSKGENAFEIIKEIKTYLDETENFDSDANPWRGNHTYLNDYRNQMTHRVSPNVTSISTLGITLRLPVMYVLHRAIEDYYKVSSFLCHIINTFLDERKDWLPFE